MGPHGALCLPTGARGPGRCLWVLWSLKWGGGTRPAVGPVRPEQSPGLAWPRCQGELITSEATLSRLKSRPRAALDQPCRACLYLQLLNKRLGWGWGTDISRMT